MLNLIRPRFFVPIHGEYRHLVLHARMAEELGIPRDNIFVIDSGQVLEFGPTRAAVNGQVSEGHVLVDGLGVGDVGKVVLRDRHLLSRDGFVVVVVALDDETRRDGRGARHHHARLCLSARRGRPDGRGSPHRGRGAEAWQRQAGGQRQD